MWAWLRGQRVPRLPGCRRTVTMSELELAAEPKAPTLSKGAQRRARKEAGAEQRREKMQLKRKATRERQKLARKAALAAGDTSLCRRRKGTFVRLDDPRASSVHVALDMGFDEVMAPFPKDMSKLAKQIERCYGENRRVARPLQLHLTSLAAAAAAAAANGAAPAAADDLSTMGGRLHAKTQGFGTWDVHRHTEHYREVWPAQEQQAVAVVYLCAESETVLERLDENTTYVIGGLVDHNRCKGLCYRLAKEGGIATARLPIAEHIPLEKQMPLAVSHVFELLLQFEQGAVSAEDGGAVLTPHERWAGAMEAVIPQRKRKQSSAAAAAAATGAGAPSAAKVAATHTCAREPPQN